MLGLLKRRITTIYSFDSVGNVTHQYTSHQQQFSRSGLLTQEKSWNENGKLRLKSLFKYNKKGKLIEKVSFDAHDQLILREDCIYDEHYQLLQSEISAADESKIIKEHFYDKEERYEKVVINSEFGEILGYEVFWFNEKENIVAELKSTAEQEVIYKRFATYDEAGHLIYEEFFGRKEQLQKTVSYQYALSGKLLQVETHFHHEALVVTERFGYDQQERLAQKEIIDQSRGEEHMAVFQYDTEGKLIRTEQFERGQLVYEIQAQYDAAGNLIEEEILNLGANYYREVRKHLLIYW